MDLDLPGDIRDVVYDATRWESTPEHIGQTALDLVGIVPAIGALKYVGEAGEVAEDALKGADKIGELAGDVGKDADEFGEASEDLGKYLDEAVDDGAGKLNLYNILQEENVPQTLTDGELESANLYNLRNGTGDAGSSVNLPPNDSQLKHIFRDADGHLSDTPTNRSLLEEVANNPENYIGTDSNGTRWFTQIQPDGSQVWVRTYNSNITNAGLNTTPKVFDPQTGLNYNPFK